MPTPIRRSLLLAAACCVAVAPTARAADGVAQVAGLWVGSERAVRDAAEQVGFPLPPTVGRGTVEGMFPFLHPGDLTGDAPAGVLFVTGDQLARAQMTAFVLPVKPGAAPLASFPNATKTAAADTVEANGFPVRRTADYLVLGGTAPVTAELAVADQAAALRPTPGGVTPLFRAWLDVAAWRSTAPGQFADAMAAWHDQNQGQADANPSRRAGAEWVEHLVRDQADRLSVSVDRTADGGWAVAAEADPFPTAHAAFDKPGLPTTIAARADLQVPAELLTRWLTEALSKQGGMSAAETAVDVKLLAACFAGDAESVGVAAAADGSPVVFCVTQRKPGSADLATDVADVRRDGRRANPRAAHRDTDADSYALADGSTAYRYTLGNGRWVLGYVDVTASGPTRYTTFARSDAHLVGALRSMPTEGTFDAPGVGWVEPAKLLDLVPSDAMPAAKRAQLKALLGPARVGWSAKPTAKGAAFAAELPAALLKAVGPAVRAMGEGQ